MLLIRAATVSSSSHVGSGGWLGSCSSVGSATSVPWIKGELGIKGLEVGELGSGGFVAEVKLTIAR